MDKVTFYVNGKKCSVGSDVSSDVTLLDYLRNFLELRGTKYMCREGGCGACIVTIVKKPGEDHVAVNSCLVSVTSCHDWEITTIEKVGNKKDGYHPIQTTLAKYNGTQCGYCTPGWVMSMYSMLQNKKNTNMLDIENSFGGIVCRCTGYRPILDAFKTFAKKAQDPVQLTDIEELKLCQKTGKNCSKNKCEENDWCLVSKDGDDSDSNIQIDLKDGKFWVRVSTVQQIFDVLIKRGDDDYMFVAGNTAKGAYPIDEYPSTLIDISGVSELKGWDLDQNLIVNAGTTLTELLDIFETVANEDNFSYLKTFYDHIKLVAHIPVRNIGTIAGNLMLKHRHNDFTSDIFLLLLTVGAELRISYYKGQEETISMEDFLKQDMKGYIIMSTLLPPLSDEYKIETYKIMPRSQNAHAIVNAGFLYQLIGPENVVEKSKIVYSGLQPPFTRATQTEKYLNGRKLFENDTLQAAVKILDKEINAVENPPEPSAAYRKQLALALFYKGLLTLCPKDKLKAKYRSGISKIHETRPVSKGEQTYDTNPLIYPLNQPIEKLEALQNVFQIQEKYMWHNKCSICTSSKYAKQCSAEVDYTEDLPSFPDEVFGAFVLSTEPSGHIENIDPSEALKLPGVISFYSAKDIPGINSFSPKGSIGYPSDEEILCSDEIKYNNQPLGILVAETRYIAEYATKFVKVSYKDVKKPILDIKEARKIPEKVKPFLALPATEKGFNVQKVIKGTFTIYYQYHFCMETLVTLAKPSEDGLEVYSSTQWIDGVHITVSRALNMDANSIDIYCRRLGGAFGLKLSRGFQGAIASCLVSKNLNRPCRFIQSLTKTMRAVGKRCPASCDYEVAVNNKGVIQYLNYNFYVDNGYKLNEIIYFFSFDAYYNVYKSSRWNFKGYNVITDTHKNTWCRSPGTLESISFAEMILERISYELSLDPAKVRLDNIDISKYNDIKEMFETLQSKANYDERRNAVNKFNVENRWKKRGLRVSFMKWLPLPLGLRLDVNLSVYHTDGTVVLTHSGAEMGQGINTRAVQIAAHFLEIPVDKIKIKGNNTIIAPNSFVSGASLTSQNVGLGVQRCCEELKKRLAPVKLLYPLASWEEIIRQAYSLNIDLQVHGFTSLPDGLKVFHTAFGVCIAEVEVDILTGESEILRVDLLEDAGRSINPTTDIGQIEGAFIMGVGYWTSEKIVFNKNNGEVLTDRTWNYYVPQARDIPQDFRVHLRKNSYSRIANLGSKAVSESPLCLSVVVPLAIREAIAAARLESGIPTTEWFDIDGPYTSETICLASTTKINDFKFN